MAEDDLSCPSILLPLRAEAFGPAILTPDAGLPYYRSFGSSRSTSMSSIIGCMGGLYQFPNSSIGRGGLSQKEPVEERRRR